MQLKLKKAIATVMGAGAIVGAIAPAAFATDNFSQGNQGWDYNTQSGRYRSNVGNHTITVACVTGTGSWHSVDLRVDIISNPDVSEGLKAYECAKPQTTYGSRDSWITSKYRGHFMQTKDVWYGTLKDSHQ